MPFLKQMMHELFEVSFILQLNVKVLPTAFKHVIQALEFIVFLVTVYDGVALV